MKAQKAASWVDEIVQCQIPSRAELAEHAMQLEPSEEQVLVSSSGDRTASVWDRRKLSPGVKPLATATATNTILGAYFSPAGMPCRLACTLTVNVDSLHVLACMHACMHP